MFYVDKFGRRKELVDRTKGLLLLKDTLGFWWRELTGIIRRLWPRQNATGRYVLQGGKLVKMSSSANAFDVWLSKHGMFPDQGDRERHNFYVDMAQKGKLNEVGDRNVWEPLRQKYGRDKVRVR